MSRKDIVGSWFPTGFHGNFLCKTRPDPCSEYRHLAKPTPPNRFMYRMTEKSAAHPFSKHDNKYMFPTDAMYLGKGVGRRKIGPKSVNENPLSWHSLQNKPSQQPPPHISGYRHDYRGRDPYHQKLIQRPATSFDVGRPVTTSYRYSHGVMNPNRDQLVDIATEASRHTGRGGIQSAKERRPAPVVDSVARCMTWCEPIRRTRVSPPTCVSPPYELDEVAATVAKPVLYREPTRHVLQESICVI